jgi:transcriptional regulator with XRE-family HTH domain
MNYNGKRREVYQMLAKNVTAFRMALHWSQQTLALVSGVSQSKISRIEQGKTATHTELMLLAKAFHCTVDDLLQPEQTGSPRVTFQKPEE